MCSNDQLFKFYVKLEPSRNPPEHNFMTTSCAVIAIAFYAHTRNCFQRIISRDEGASAGEREGEGGGI